MTTTEERDSIRTLPDTTKTQAHTGSPLTQILMEVHLMKGRKCFVVIIYNHFTFFLSWAQKLIPYLAFGFH